MFKKFPSALTLVKNLDNIRLVVGATYTAVVKTLAVLVFLQGQANDTKLGVVLEKYLPTIILLLSKVKEVFEKYGKYIGFTPPVDALAESVDGSLLLAELDASVAHLNQLLAKK